MLNLVVGILLSCPVPKELPVILKKVSDLSEVCVSLDLCKSM